MNGFLGRHRAAWREWRFIGAVFFGAILLIAGLLATYYANIYTTTHASNAVTDIILDNIPVVNVDFVFNDGAFIFIALVVLVALYEPRRIPFVLKSIALFSIVRSIFMVLTHIAPPVERSYLDTADFLYKLSSGGDLFFSAHTGLPFMFAFIFWDERWLRYLFLALTAIGGTAVLLGHLHYSIDVFSALFISFGVFRLSVNLFRKDYQLLRYRSATTRGSTMVTSA
jgi:hypothetical protein